MPSALQYATLAPGPCTSLLPRGFRCETLCTQFVAHPSPGLRAGGRGYIADPVPLWVFAGVPGSPRASEVPGHLSVLKRFPGTLALAETANRGVRRSFGVAPRGFPRASIDVKMVGKPGLSW